MEASSRRVLWISCQPLSAEGRVTPGGVEGFIVVHAPGVPEALEELKSHRTDAVVANFPLSDWTSEEAIEAIQRVDSVVPVIVRDPDASIADVVRLSRLGAFQFLEDEPDAAELLEHLERAAEEREQRELALFGPSTTEESWRHLLVGEGRAMQDVARVIRLVGPKRCTVLITGETGTGKELVARALHMASPRRHLPMVTVNCSALPENLLEAELFGHVKGAFTGAISHRTGLFEQANKSTIFLDEVAEIPLDLQAKLLRVLQEREFQRLGSSETVRVDVRVIAASNVDLTQRVKQGKFREDLYYRLNVVPIQMPPLRQRAGDIPLLVGHFVEKFSQADDVPPKRIGPETLQRLCSEPWPGNVRQLENAVEMALVMSGTRNTLYPSDFPVNGPAKEKVVCIQKTTVSLPDDGLDFDRAVGDFERGILQEALRRAGGNKSLAADLLRLKRTTLLAKLRNLEIENAVAAACSA